MTFKISTDKLKLVSAGYNLNSVGEFMGADGFHVENAGRDGLRILCKFPRPDDFGLETMDRLICRNKVEH